MEALISVKDRTRVEFGLDGVKRLELPVDRGVKIVEPEWGGRVGVAVDIIGFSFDRRAFVLNKVVWTMLFVLVPVSLFGGGWCFVYIEKHVLVSKTNGVFTYIMSI